MTRTRHLRLSRRIINHLQQSSGSYILRRKITQKIRDAAYAFNLDGLDDGSGFWWHAANGRKLTRVKPRLCGVGDWFVVLYRGQPLSDSTLSLQVLHVAVDRLYDAEGFHSDTARAFRPIHVGGEQLIDNPWAWIVTCKIIRKTRDIA